MSDAVTAEWATPSAPLLLDRAALRAAILARFPSSVRASLTGSSLSVPRSELRVGDMASSTCNSDGELSPQTVGQRWALSLSRRYPADAVKRIMADFGAAEGTVKGWLQGQPPQHRHMVTAVKLFGHGIVAEMYAPESQWQRREELRRDLDALEHRIRAVREAHGW